MKLYSISPSKLQAYADCPRCFLLSMQKGKFVPNAAMIFGTRVHKAIESYHRNGIVDVDEDLQIYLDAYMEKYDEDFDAAEEFWKVQLLDTDMALNLKIDLIKDNILIDHKTASRMYSQQDVDEQKQLSAYSWAWSKKFDIREDHIRFNIFLTNPKPDQEILQIIDTERTPEDLLEWEEWTREILSGIANDEFEPKPARWHNYEECPFYKERE